jgi:uncharacterized protein YbgA (DUF1722 family)/uncharacterized protein YbbK (DUF523 family)
MSDSFPRPRLVVSKCLELEACRYNGVSIRAPLVTRLQPHVELLPTCPEVEIGLGVPRDPVRLVAIGGDQESPHMVQPSTGRDLTEAMTSFSNEFLSSVEPVDGFLLKSRSPSCGIKDTKVFTPPKGDADRGMPVGKGAGLFARAVLERFGDRAIEDDGRLTNFRIRHHFLTKMFTLARLRRVAEAAQMSALVEFHAAHKLLLMAYHQTAMRALGRLVANPDRRPVPEVLADYRTELARALARPARYTSHVNVLMHAMGYFKDGLTAREKRHFLDSLTEYREGRLPLSAPLLTLQSWIARFGEDYLERQIYFEPYPRELLDLSDSGGTPPR